MIFGREHWRQGKGGFADFEGIKLCYGPVDTNAPFAIGRQMEARLKRAGLRMYEGKTHMSIVDHTEEILRDLYVERKVGGSS
jgi:hypothetical protein